MVLKNHLANGKNTNVRGTGVGDVLIIIIIW